MRDIDDYEIIAAMEMYGGNFVQQLARLFHSADHINRARLKVAFADYWKQYADIVVDVKARA